MSVQGKPVSGYVEMTQVQAAYLGSGNAGNGTLRYRGHTYPFSVGGLGVGGIGISKIEARGEVYGLERLRDFPGAYVQGRYGLALGKSRRCRTRRRQVHAPTKEVRSWLPLQLRGEQPVESISA